MEHSYEERKVLFDNITDKPERKALFDTIKILDKPEQEEIFRIIRKAKENYTENSNGIFFDLSTISNESFSLIKEYINFYDDLQDKYPYASAGVPNRPDAMALLRLSKP